MADMRFLADSSIEPDTPRSTLMGSSSPDDCDDLQRQKGSQWKRRRSSNEEELNSKRSLMYDAAIQYMQQNPGPATPPPPSDEDMFGQYVASQLKLLDNYSKLQIKAQINNLFLSHQMREISSGGSQNPHYTSHSYGTMGSSQPPQEAQSNIALSSGWYNFN